MRIVELDQRSDEWKTWRQKGVGASDACVVVHGEHFGRDRESLWREKLGLEKKQRGNWAMSQGVSSEAEIRAWYEELLGVDAPPLCCLHDEHDWLKASLDGWVQAASIPVELKYASRERHEKALAGAAPEEYLPQLNHQLLVTGATTAHYVSFNPRFPVGRRFALVEHTPDLKEIEEHLRLVSLFWQSVVSKTPPRDEDYEAALTTPS